jgi:hypothetical protein
MVVYLTKWSLGQTPGTEYYSSRRVDHLFVYAPATYEWHDLLVDRPELKTYATPIERTTYLNENTYWWNKVSAYLVGLWLKLAVLIIVGFGYSYFFTAGTMIYLLMRQRVDDTETDEVYTDEDFPDEPMMSPSAPAAKMSNGPQTQMVDAPTLRTPTPASPETTEYKPGG